MERQDVVKMMGVIASAYPNLKEVTEETIDVWYSCLKDIDSKFAFQALQRHIFSNIYPPTIADIRKIIAESLPNAENFNPALAWEEAIKAIKKYGYTEGKEGMKSLSPATAKTVKSIGWLEMCTETNLSVLRGQFMRMYEMIAEGEKKKAMFNKAIAAEERKELPN